MALHKALKPFGWYPNGYEREALVEGDVRDFGDVAEGLVDAKMIAPVDGLELIAVPQNIETQMQVAAIIADRDSDSADEIAVEESASASEESAESDSEPKRRGRSRK